MTKKNRTKGKLRVGISGFGRIGKGVVRAYLNNARFADIFDIVCINNPGGGESAEHLYNYDTVYGVSHQRMEYSDNHLRVGNIDALLTDTRDLSALGWESQNVDVIMDCTGLGKTRTISQGYLDQGIDRVLISSPSDQADIMAVYGVNHEDIRHKDKIISAASCTTNAAAPLLSSLMEMIDIQHCYLSTVHAYTGDQSLIDRTHKNLRRSRAACASIIPTTTGAIQALAVILPSLKGRLDGSSIRVPVICVSLLELIIHHSSQCTVQTINKHLEMACGKPNSVMSYTDKELVSVDFIKSPYSCVFDATQTKTIGNSMLSVGGWYDNEYGFSVRMCDMVCHLTRTMP